MNLELTILAWTFTALLLFLLIVSILAGRGVIPLNHLIGIRLPALTWGDGAWRAGHRAAVMPAAIAFAVALVFALGGLITPWAYLVAIAAFVIGFACAAIRASLVGARVQV
ncbi:MAG: hypothetical protein V4479_11860 [Actinomycetota bacterium]